MPVNVGPTVWNTRWNDNDITNNHVATLNIADDQTTT
tara:strand:- start:4676 stop:4786 length:111 start_codon:yes stop_codon:yes gene_type:complete